MAIVMLLIGVLIGILSAVYIFRRIVIGTLRVDCSDESSAPYFFLEIEKNKAMTIYASRYVCLKVSLESYIPRE